MGKQHLLISLCLLGEPCRYDGKSVPMSGEVIARLKEKYTLEKVIIKENDVSDIDLALEEK